MGLNRSCALLIVIAGMERFAFKGVASNLVTYLTDVVKMSNSSAAKMVNSWCGLTSMFPLLVAPLADSYWDTYSTIMASSFFYIAGLVSLTSTALASSQHTESNSSLFAFLFWSLCLISVGLGGYNPSLQAFGTDQLEDEEELPSSKDDKRSNKKSLFFQWWYFGICGGSLLGTTVLSYIQDTVGWVLGFALPTGAMLTSVMLFSCGSKIYVYKQDRDISDTPFRSLVKFIKFVASKVSSRQITLASEKPDMVELELQEKPLCQNTLSLEKVSEEKNSKSGFPLLANAKVVLRLLPIWTMLLMFAVIFQQPATFFTKQGMVMKRNIGSNFMIPPATLQSAITLSIILLMPLYDKMLIPIIRVFTQNEKGINVMQRMGIGMVLSIIAMVIAALVETKRLEIVRNAQSHGLNAEQAKMSIFWLLPQYILLGVSDVFTVVGMQEFFYSEVPLRMRIMGFALYTSVFGVGSFLSALMIQLTEVFTRGHSWFSDDMNKARLDNYYWLLAVVSTLSLLLYIILCYFFTSRNQIEDDESCK